MNALDEEEVYITSNITLNGKLQKSSPQSSSSILFDKLKVTESGFVEINATGSTSRDIVTKVIDVKNAKQTIKIILSDNIINVNQAFDLRIYVSDQYNSAWSENTKLYISDGINNYEKLIENGYYTRNITFYDEGNHSITVKTSEGTVAKKELEVKNSVSKISSYFNNDSVTAFFPALLTISVYGDDEKLFTNPVNLTAYYKSGASSLKKIELIVENGFKEVEIFFEDFSEDAICNLTYGYLSTYRSSSSKIQVYPNKIVLSHSSDWIPKYTEESFEFDLKIMDHKEKQIETTYGSYNVSFELAGNETGLGGSQQTVTTKGGKVKVSDLFLKNTGSYQLKILCETCETFVTEEFEIKSDYCEFSIVTLCIMGALIFLLLVCSVVFHLADKNIVDGNAEYRDYLDRNRLYHPLISLFVRQPTQRRLINSVQLLVGDLSLFTLIGLIYFYYDTPSERYDKNFTDFYSRQLYKGATGWAFAQAISMSLFLFKLYSITQPKIRMYFYVTCFIVTILDTGLIIWMSVIYCKGYIMFWTVNFLIFMVIDLILIQSLLALLTMCIIPSVLESQDNHNTDPNHEPDANPDHGDEHRMVPDGCQIK